MEIKHSDLIQLLAQFLQESNLLKTLDALSAETDIQFNFVPSKVEIKNLIINGSILDLLDSLKNWELSNECTERVYILIIYELLLKNEIDLAMHLLGNAPPLMHLRDYDSQKYFELSEMTAVRVDFLEEQRLIVAELVLKELEEV